MTAGAEELALLQRSIWRELDRAIVDKHHEWRTPVLATMSDFGPETRCVVLRDVSASQHELTFYSDKRSPKIAQLRADARASMNFWSKRTGWQLRVRLRANVIESGMLVNEVWQRVSQSAAAGDYLSALAPGAPLGVLETTAASEHQLCVVVCQVLQFDWLHLARTGHRRAEMRLNDAENSARWLQP